MWKFIGYISVATCFGILMGMLFSKALTLVEIKNAVSKLLQGILSRFDQSIKGNDDRVSSTRILDYMWGIGSFSLICLCTLRDIKIQEGVLYLLGGALGIGGVKGVINKMTEIKDKKESTNV